jgi:hypothetical protein
MIRRLRGAVLLCAAPGLVVAASAAAAAEHHSVALVSADAQWLRSVQIALSAWDITVIEVDASPLGSSLPDAQRNAADVAKRVHSDAVVWVSGSESGSVLWIYDVETQHVGSRVLADRQPFDEPTAAAAALSVKALLRSSALAPAPERVEGPPTFARRVLWIEAEAGFRFLPAAVAEPRAALALALWPRGLDERLGFAVSGSAGLGAPVETQSPTTLDVRFKDVSVSPSLRTRLRLGSAFVVEPSIGASFHFTTLEGAATSDHSPVLIHRLDESLDVAASFDVRAGSACLGIRADLDYLPRYQRYFVHGAEAFSLTPFMAGVSLRIGADVL